MKIMIVGGTGFLGYHSLLEAKNRGHVVDALAIDDVILGDWYPKDVKLDFGDVFELSEQDLLSRFSGYDAMIYAVGPDDRITPPAPAYDFFHSRLVDSVEKVATAARKAGVKRFALLNSYFAYFDRILPEKNLSKFHPYIRCRVEQAERIIAAGKNEMAVMVLELPYIFGSMPNRIPLWKDVFLDRFAKGKTIYFPKGGTNMIAVEHVAEAIIGAIESGEHGMKYPIGDENHTFNEMLEMMMSAIGENKKIINIPRPMAVMAGWFMEKNFKRKGLEGGLEAAFLMRDIMTDYFYFDPEESVKKLGYKRGGLEEAIFKTMKACYPEKFKEADQ
ncbi:MAG: NAD(P)H-binding protein [Actinomycetota bacterium]|jgi:nucleoside-diphosphate-sugar epimerase|nr:NAD(P)H-binding protein [Actinomycetota bacterium]